MKINSNNFFHRGSPRHPSIFSPDFPEGSPVRTVHRTHIADEWFFYIAYILVLFMKLDILNTQWNENVVQYSHIVRTSNRRYLAFHQCEFYDVYSIR